MKLVPAFFLAFWNIYKKNKAEFTKYVAKYYNHYNSLYCNETGVRKISPEENCSPVRARVRVRIKVGEQFSSGAIVLEPTKPFKLCCLRCSREKSLNSQVGRI